METIKRLSIQPIPNISPKRWQILLDLKIDPKTGEVIAKKLGELVSDDATGYFAIAMINDTPVVKESFQSYTDHLRNRDAAIKWFCIWVRTLIDNGSISRDPLKRLS